MQDGEDVHAVGLRAVDDAITLEDQFSYIVAAGFRDMPSDVRMILQGIDGLDQPVNKLFSII